MELLCTGRFKQFKKRKGCWNYLPWDIVLAGSLDIVAWSIFLIGSIYCLAAIQGSCFFHVIDSCDRDGAEHSRWEHQPLPKIQIESKLNLSWDMKKFSICFHRLLAKILIKTIKRNVVCLCILNLGWEEKWSFRYTARKPAPSQFPNQFWQLRGIAKSNMHRASKVLGA